MANAFQSNAFQSDAFQIETEVSLTGVAATGGVGSFGTAAPAITVAGGSGPDYAAETANKSVNVAVASGDMLVFGFPFRSANSDAFGLGGGTVTYNGVALTRLAATAAPTSAFYQCALFGITNPVAGTHSLTVSPAGQSLTGNSWYAVVSNALVSAGFATATTNASDSAASPQNVSVSTTSGGVAFDATLLTAPAASPSIQNGATLIRAAADPFFANQCLGGYKTDATQLGWSWSGGSAAVAQVASYVQAQASSPGVSFTIALAGVAGTGAAGAVAPQFSVALSGVSATGQTSAPGTAVGLSGVAGTGASGAPTAQFAVALSGVSATGQTSAPGTGLGLDGAPATSGTGSLSLSFEVALSGVGATSAVGIEAAGASRSLSGVEGTGAAGAAGIDFLVALAGAPATGDAGALDPTTQISVDLAGVSASGSVGSTAVSVDAAPAGSAAASAAGSLSPNFDVALSGVQATGAVGIEAAGSQRALSGAEANGQVGSAGVAFVVSLSGVAATGAAGVVDDTQGEVFTAGVSGVSADGETGSLSVSISVGLQGASSTGAVGSVFLPGEEPQQPSHEVVGPQRAPRVQPPTQEFHGTLKISGGGHVVLHGHSEIPTPAEQVLAFLYMAA